MQRYGSGRDLIFSTDYDNPHDQPDAEVEFFADKISLNTAGFLARRSDWTRSFLDSVYTDFPEAISALTWEQQAIKLFREAHAAEFRSHCAIVPYRHMNSWWRKFVAGDFVLHHADGHTYKDKYSHLWELLRDALAGRADWRGNTLNAHASPR